MPAWARWLAAGSIVGFLGGLGLGAQLWQREAPVEAPAPEVRRPDGSVILERAPDSGARPATTIPRGAVLERVTRVVVVPENRPPVPAIGENVSRGTSGELSTRRDSSGKPEEAVPCECHPVALELSLIRLQDGSRRVIAQATGGTIVGGVDIPVEAALPPKVLPWAVGLEADLLARGIGLAVDRDLERVAFLKLPYRVGLTATPAPEPRLGVRVQIRF